MISVSLLEPFDPDVCCFSVPEFYVAKVLSDYCRDIEYIQNRCVVSVSFFLIFRIINECFLFSCIEFNKKFIPSLSQD